MQIATQNKNNISLETAFKVIYLRIIYMKSNLLILTILLIVIFELTNCSKDCESTISTCKETPPTDELCQAYFNRWFFKEDKNKCEQIGYSGCSQKGFDTLAECEECECK
ncbi:MAG: BPTI/Kunitz-type proteinase inhibitor domain-containing protein [Cyclobacteriaceae bacterium]|nr:BPTI/Kunitz-type proteinase inhibitor domain-containing protein [Cyclobacteriaceae bacterium]